MVSFVKKHFTFLSIILFALISFLMFFPFLYIYKWGAIIPYSNFDIAFHLASVKDAYISLSKGHLNNIFTGISTHSFGKFGYPISFFYPTLTFLPEIFIHFFLKNSWISFLIFSGLVAFLIQISMYFFMEKIFHSKKVALFCALIYIFSSYLMQTLEVSKDIALAISYIFLPMVFYGTFEIIFGNRKKWYLLSVGMALLCFSHLMSFLNASLLVGFLIIYLIFRNERIKIKLLRLKDFIYSILLTVALTATFIFSFINFLKSTGKTAISGYAYNLWFTGFSLQDLFFNGVQSSGFNVFNSDFGFNCISFVVVILIIISFKNLPSFLKYCSLGIFVFTFLSTKLFPWQLFNSTFGSIQWVVRFMQVSYFLIAIVGGYAIVSVCQRIKQKGDFYSIGFASFLIIIGLLLSTETIANIGLQNVNPDNGSYLFQPKLTNKQIKVPPQADPNNKYRFSVARGFVTPKQFNKYGDQFNTLDYIPEKSIPIQNNLYSHSIKSMNLHLKGIKQTHWSTSYNSIHYRITSKKSISKLALPNIYYPGFHAYVNNKEVPIHVGKQHQIEIPVKKGKDKINLIYKDTSLKIISDLISMLAWFGLISYLLFSWIRNRFIKNRTKPRHVK